MKVIKQIEDALKAGPTDGPWIAAGPSRGMALPQYLNEVVVNREGDDDDTYLVCACPLGLDGDQGSSVTMDYIAVCNPANMREVLTNIAAQDAKIARLRVSLTRIQEMHPELPVVYGTCDWYATIANASRMIAADALNQTKGTV